MTERLVFVPTERYRRFLSQPFVKRALEMLKVYVKATLIFLSELRYLREWYKFYSDYDEPQYYNPDMRGTLGLIWIGALCKAGDPRSYTLEV